VARIIPVSTDTLAGKRWKRSSDYRFAADKIVCPIDYSEVSRASLNMPLAFVKSGQDFVLVVVNGLAEGKNLYVDLNGRWLADYVPLEFRLHPFLLADSGEGQIVLCIDEESGLISDSSDDLEFFQSGQPTSLLKNVMEALVARHTRRINTEKLVKQIADLDLIKEWSLDLKLDNNNLKVSGLNCINEDAVATLTGDQLAALRDSGALALIYCQMLSMHQIQYLLKLHKRLANTEPSLQKVSSDELRLDGLTSDTGTLSFDNI